MVDLSRSRDDHGGKSMSRELRVFRAPIRAALAMLALALVAVGLQTGLASGVPPKPVRIQFDRVFTSLTAPSGTPGAAVPYAIVLAGQPFSIEVSFYDADGQPAAFGQDTPLSISTTTGSTNQPMPATGTAFAGDTTATLTTTLASPANQVRVTVSAPTLKGPKAVAPGTATLDQRFDVLSELRYDASAANTAFTAGIGGTDNCAAATIADPVCGTLMLPNGAFSSQVLLSRGLCDTTYAACGSTRGSVLQFLADIEGLYTSTSPATMLVRCDKSLCGKKAIAKTGLSYSLLGNAALAPAPACPAKNTLGPLQEVCVDYVQSSRDNAGDSLMYLRVRKDARISVS
jgi:hypothetical protein